MNTAAACQLDLYTPECWGLGAALRQVAADDSGHEALRARLSVPTTRYLWVPEDAITFTPPLSDAIYGDGRALLCLTTLYDRPACWFVRVDSRWAEDDCTDIYEYADLITANLALEFGNGEPGYHDEQEEDESDPYPAINAQDGCSWELEILSTEEKDD